MIAQDGADVEVNSVALSGGGGGGDRLVPVDGRESEDDAQRLRRLADVIGFPVLPPGLGYPNSKTKKCCKVGLMGVLKAGGTPWWSRGKCRDRNCMRRCNGEWARRTMSGFVLDIGDTTFVYFVPTPPDQPSAVRDRIRQRAEAARHAGVEVKLFVIPCDEGIFVFSSSSLTAHLETAKTAPVQDHPLFRDDAEWLMMAVLTSGRITANAQIFISPEWKPRIEVKEEYFVCTHDDPKVSQVALKILEAEKYEYRPPPSDAGRWTQAAAYDPIDVFYEAMARAEAFLDDPQCATCGRGVAHTARWVSRGGADASCVCRDCDVADCAVVDDSGTTQLDVVVDLLRSTLLDARGGLTEEELNERCRLHFDTDRGRLEQAMAFAGAHKLGVRWVMRPGEP